MSQTLLNAKRLGFRFLLICAVMTLAAAAWAQNGTIKLTIFPDVIFADGVSPTTVQAEVRDQNGSTVPDGTTVVFESKLGTFDLNTQTTIQGIARATLRAATAAGVTVVRVSALRFNAFAEHQIEFVSDRRILESTLKPFEISGTSSLTYSVQDHLFEASGEKEGASLKFGRVTVTATELQFNINTGIVKAHTATLKVGNVSHKYDELSFDPKSETGIAFGQIFVPPKVVSADKILFFVPPKIRNTYIDLSHDKSVPHEGLRPVNPFDFGDVMASMSLVTANRATVIPDKAIQFQHAALRVSNQTIMRQPYFELPLYITSEMITEQFVSLNNNQLAVNVPYYLSLNPSSTSSLRLRYSSPFGGGSGYAAGTFLDYQLNWNSGSLGNGNFTVGGIGRDDWGLSLQQSWSTPGHAIINASLDSPNHQSLLGSLGYTQPLKGATMSLNYGHVNNFLDGSTQQSLSGLFEVDPKPLSFLPATVAYGLTANSVTGSFGTQSAGVEARINSKTFDLGSLGKLRSSYRVAELYGASGIGTSQYFGLGLSTSLRNGLNVETSYDFSYDPFAFSQLGHQHLNAEAYYLKGGWSMSAYMQRSLDFDRLSSRVSLARNLGGPWRVEYYNSYDQLLGDTSFDQVFTLAYKLGMRAVGITFSQRTQRLGFEVIPINF